MRFPWPSLRAKIRRALLPAERDGWLLQAPLEKSFAREVSVRTGAAAKVHPASECTPDECGLDGLFEFDPAVVQAGWAGLSRQAWSRLHGGGFLAVAIAQEPYIAIALATAHGWLTCQCVKLADGGTVLVLQKPQHGEINPLDLNAEVESPRWQKFAPPVERQKHVPARTDTPGKRRCHIIGCSIAKSGTSSLAGLFSQYRARHEFEATRTIRQLSGSAGDLAPALDGEWVRGRDERGGLLECDSSQLHHWYLPTLVKTFPDARFIVTIRPPRPWLASIMNHRLARGLSPEWEFVDRLRFGRPTRDAAGPESILASYGLPGLSHFLQFWVAHHVRVLAEVPAHRLLLLPLAELDRSADVIASFAGVPAETLTPGSARLNEARADFHLLDRLEDGYVDGLITRICGSTWDQLCARVDTAAA